jgi:type II secretory pathway pseudopilin PulG
MRSFTKKEKVGIGIILSVILILTTLNLRISLRKSRDAQRRSDIGAMSDALDKYQKDFGFFPPSTPDGKILACKGENFGNFPDDIPEGEKRNYFFKTLRGCNWGEDGLRDVNDDTFEPYLKTIPNDPSVGMGYSYLYLSDINRYQLYAYLEGGSGEIGFRDGIVARDLNCGSNICNFGKGFGDTPLEKSIEEYENEIRQK